MQIVWEALKNILSGYTVDSDTDTLLNTSDKKRVYINPDDTVFVLLYLITKHFGVHSEYIVQIPTTVEDKDLDEEDGEATTTLDTYVTLEDIVGKEKDLNSFGIYLGVAHTTRHSLNNRLAILNTADLKTQELFETKLYDHVRPLLEHTETVDRSWIPQYIYFEGITNRESYSHALHLLNSYNYYSQILFSYNVEDKVFDSRLALSTLMLNYQHVLQDKVYCVFSSTEPWMKSLEANILAYNPVRIIYEDLVSRPEEFFIINYYEVNDTAIGLLALAFCTHGKKSIFVSRRAEFTFNTLCKEMLSASFGYLDQRIRAHYDQFQPNTMIVNYDINQSNLAIIRNLFLNLKFKMIDLDKFGTFIKYNPNINGYTIASSSKDKFPQLTVETEKTLFIDEYSEELGYRYEFHNIVDVLTSCMKLTDTTQIESYLYATLQFLSQVLWSYKKLLTLRDLLIIEDRKTNTMYIGSASFSPTINADILHLGSINTIDVAKLTSGQYLSMDIIYDFERVADTVKTVLEKYKYNISDIALSYYKVSDRRYIEMCLYYICTQPYSNSLQYQYIEDTVASKIDLQLASRHAYTLTQRLLPHLKELIEPYGFRLLKINEAPLTIYGGINYNNATGKTLNMYLDVFKKLPVGRGG